jgi:hypothetical protein
MGALGSVYYTTNYLYYLLFTIVPCVLRVRIAHLDTAVAVKYIIILFKQVIIEYLIVHLLSCIVPVGSTI